MEPREPKALSGMPDLHPIAPIAIRIPLRVLRSIKGMSPGIRLMVIGGSLLSALSDSTVAWSQVDDARLYFPGWLHEWNPVLCLCVCGILVLSFIVPAEKE